ncbi:MAG: MCE family protein [Proteobacteria bacterium]|nr:MCE family protein [Pseudomonadota bacterium]
MKSNMVEALIGAMVLALAGGFFYFTYERTDFGTVSGYELTARFDRIDGIGIGSDVRLAGIKVGSVLGQEIDTVNYQAIVRISVRRDLQLPTDTFVRVASEGLLGGSYLLLDAGGMDEYLKDGDEFEFTESAMDLQNMIGQAIFNAGGGEDDGSDGSEAGNP